MSPIASADARLLRRVRCAALVGCLLVAAPLAAHAGSSRPTNSSAYGHISDAGGSFSWGLLDPADGATLSDSDGDDWREVQRLMRTEDLPVFWFRQGDRNYVVRDRNVVARVTELAEPMRELGRKQGSLGDKQGALGDRQSRIGARQAALGARQARLAAKLSGLVSYGSSDDRAAARERREIEEVMAELADQQAELGREQAPLGRLQAELGREQAAMGREQAQISKRIGVEIRRLAEDALKTGKAAPVRARKSI